jgi:tRNA threonylcarbamoyladenosine biosynthesis protein TsaE
MAAWPGIRWRLRVIEMLSTSPEQTMAVAACLARHVLPGTVVSLDSQIGAGKTVWCKGFINASCGVDVDEVTSPAFSLVNEYVSETGAKVFHIDFYRLNEMSSTDWAMFDEYISNPGAISLLEWGGKFVRDFTSNFISVSIEYLDGLGDDIRRVRIEALGTCELPATLRAECEATC